MPRSRLPAVVALLAALVLSRPLRAAEVTPPVKSPMPPPAWALHQRELLRANAAACAEFFSRYCDERGYLHKTCTSG